MDTATRKPAPAVAALCGALDAYASWICSVAKPTDSSGDIGVGQLALREALAIRSTWFPHVTRETTEVLVGHMEITSFLYERQLRRLREGTTGVVEDVDRWEGLAQRQLAAIEMLRGAVSPQDGTSLKC